MNFFDAFPILMDFEGHGTLTDHPNDTGGKTKWGITEAVARENGFTGDMADLTMGMAMGIAQTQYWDAVQADRLPEEIRYLVFDGAFNSGVRQSIKWLQRACKIDDDGIIGPQTLAALQKNDPNVLKMRICSERLFFLTGLSNFTIFGKGWTNRVAHIMRM